MRRRGVNGQPLSLIIAWYELRADCVLQALLLLGIKGIRLGPTLPAFTTPNVLVTLVKNVDITPIGTADEDLKVILGSSTPDQPLKKGGCRHNDGQPLL